MVTSPALVELYEILHPDLLDFPYAFPGKEITYTGRLIGFRDLENRSESWDDLELFPGIDVTGSGY